MEKEHEEVTRAPQQKISYKILIKQFKPILARGNVTEISEKEDFMSDRVQSVVVDHSKSRNELGFNCSIKGHGTGRWMADEDEERLDWVLKVLERYQITLESQYPIKGQQVAGVHQEAPDFSFADYLFLDVIWLKDIRGMSTYRFNVNRSWVLVRCNPKSRTTSELWKIKPPRSSLPKHIKDRSTDNKLQDKEGQNLESW
ncbi:hypothetical protein PPACK8108_LOCUS11974 [Phakopsora pachyrhizi]|uniref:Uncharacterized protein n=1 Tax=Phakopsora pachyrhizi TaxID=170000 RepID=A0AAV0B2I6_PHAPC|nr:hypothetical protein PPACK8108_LOCUS11974 [Phakopsora pachyrhizi]